MPYFTTSYAGPAGEPESVRPTAASAPGKWEITGNAIFHNVLRRTSRLLFEAVFPAFGPPPAPDVGKGLEDAHGVGCCQAAALRSGLPSIRSATRPRRREGPGRCPWCRLLPGVLARGPSVGDGVPRPPCLPGESPFVCVEQIADFGARARPVGWRWCPTAAVPPRRVPVRLRRADRGFRMAALRSATRPTDPGHDVGPLATEQGRNEVAKQADGGVTVGDPTDRPRTRRGPAGHRAGPQRGCQAS